MMINQFYAQLYTKIGHPFAFAGFFTFQALHYTAIIKSPIHEENIFTHSTSYYPKETQLLENVTAFVVGAVANFHADLKKDLLKNLEVVLYNNPYDKQGELTTHAHGLIFKKPIQAVKDIHPEVVLNTVHVLADQSIIQKIKGEIFIIGQINDVS
jgi:hypothetical protein